jgi:hypothetical protein
MMVLQFLRAIYAHPILFCSSMMALCYLCFLVFIVRAITRCSKSYESPEPTPYEENDY